MCRPWIWRPARPGLTALYGLVYSWEIVVRVEEPTADEAQEVESYHFTGSWADAEAAAQESLEEHVLFGGSADISTCAGSASTITI
ncbi:hypothetical protein [Nocardia wallacei]|uniref:hypothetical protein n=1 Tax=Nocardia wallacei TaxID=480035 RepID=UPI00245533EF|nr:hypothetical protein [Nocardia wallacei]